ncbi:DnaB-like helicase C-terminal domain-containing protein [Ammonifex degensii]|uniref:DnaB-like helicase C-terminal domain-containing protein n=1 Tax=Ammonifex degensii TaxID=42838 RepID=UPI00030F2FE6|nr:DnaB-like helicase C-terminal domain-containing protein [Ammonifex degensii]
MGFLEYRSGSGLETVFADVELERAVLAALARDEQAFYSYAEDYLVPEVFHDPGNRAKFLELVEAYASGRPAPEVEGEPAPDLAAAVGKLCDLAQRRRVAVILEKFWRDLGSGKAVQDALAELVERAAEAQQAVKALAPGETRTAAELLREAVAVLGEQKRQKEETGRETPHPAFGKGLWSLDDLLGGMQPAVYALGGQPGVGKTFFSIYCASRYLTAAGDTGVVWVDVHETRPAWKLAVYLSCSVLGKCPQLYERLLADPAELLEGLRVDRVLERFVVLTAERNTTLLSVRGAVRRLMAQQGVKRVMVVVDYIQKLASYTSVATGQDMRLRVASAVSALTTLVGVCQGPVWLISGVAKDAYRRGAKDEASVADFKEAGEVEYSADVGLQLRWADDPRNSDVNSAVKALKLHVVKNRFGATGVVNLYSLQTECRYLQADPGYVSRPPELCVRGEGEAEGDDIPF